MVSRKELYKFQRLTHYPLCVQTKEEAKSLLFAENKAHLCATTVINCYLDIIKQYNADWPHGAKMF